jgi:hypothetical protein
LLISRQEFEKNRLNPATCSKTRGPSPEQRRIIQTFVTTCSASTCYCGKRG